MFPLSIEYNRPLKKTARRLLVLTGLLAPLAGCLQEMANQPRVETMEENRFFDDRIGARPQVPGTIARGQSWEQTPETTGTENGEPIAKIPLPVDDKLLAEGRKHFGIWCDHCHGPAGHADGMVVQRGFPRPPSYHVDRLRGRPDGHLFRVITAGHGRMPPFGSRIDPPTRWAIVAYVRALQLSQHAPENLLEDEDRTELNTESP